MSTSHLINANTHRMKEGARVLEDVARFMLRNDLLFNRIRSLRHALHGATPILDDIEDLGGARLGENNARCNLIDIIQANALRMQEALRVLEEFHQDGQQKHYLKSLRYQAYEIQRDIFIAANQFLRVDKLRGLYLVIDTSVIAYPLSVIAEVINASNVTIVQYRNKHQNKSEFYRDASHLKNLLDKNKVYIINDHIDVALDLADGIHLGQDDFPLDRIRHIVPDTFIYGISCHNQAEAAAAQTAGATYLSIGCLHPTNSKPDVTPTSLKTLEDVCKTSSIPVCAIGGMNQNNIDEVVTRGASMAAMISYPWSTTSPLTAIQKCSLLVSRHSNTSCNGNSNLCHRDKILYAEETIR